RRRHQRIEGGPVEGVNHHAGSRVARAALHRDHVLGRPPYAVLRAEERTQAQALGGGEQIRQMPKVPVDRGGIADRPHPQPLQSGKAVRHADVQPRPHARHRARPRLAHGENHFEGPGSRASGKRWPYGASSSPRASRKTRTGSGTPRKSCGPRSSYASPERSARSSAASVKQISPGPVTPRSREATFTASPKTSPPCRRSSPALIATRTWSRSASLARWLNAASRSWMAAPQAMARVAESKTTR